MTFDHITKEAARGNINKAVALFYEEFMHGKLRRDNKVVASGVVVAKHHKAEVVGDNLVISYGIGATKTPHVTVSIRCVEE